MSQYPIIQQNIKISGISPGKLPITSGLAKCRSWEAVMTEHECYNVLLAKKLITEFEKRGFEYIQRAL